MHTVPQNEDKFTINNLFYCYEALIFTHPLVYEFRCGLIFMAHPVQYLIWKIWFMSVWRLKAKVMAWLLTWFISAQNTLISYHTEAFVKTEVGCTVSLIKLYFIKMCLIFDEPQSNGLSDIMNILSGCKHLELAAENS